MMSKQKKNVWKNAKSMTMKKKMNNTQKMIGKMS